MPTHGGAELSILLWSLLSLLSVTPGGWGCTDRCPLSPPVPLRPGCLWVGSVPAPSPSCASLLSSCTHTNPFIVVPGTTGTTAGESGDTGGPGPHCQDKPHKPPWERVPRASWARASLQRSAWCSREELPEMGGVEWVQPDLGLSRAAPQARWAQPKPCAAAKPGQDPHRPPSSGFWRVLQWQSHILVPTSASLGAPTASSVSPAGTSPRAQGVPILPFSST